MSKIYPAILLNNVQTPLPIQTEIDLERLLLGDGDSSMNDFESSPTRDEIISLLSESFNGDVYMEDVNGLNNPMQTITSPPYSYIPTPPPHPRPLKKPAAINITNVEIPNTTSSIPTSTPNTAIQVPPSPETRRPVLSNLPQINVGRPIIMQAQQPIPIPPQNYIPYGGFPFWTAAPMPFSPMAYPQVIVPASEEVPLCPPSSNPRAKKIAEQQKKKERSKNNSRIDDQPRQNKISNSKSKDTSTNLPDLKTQLEDLRTKLTSSEKESNHLMEKLKTTENELSLLKQKQYTPTPPSTPVLMYEVHHPVQTTPFSISPPKISPLVDIYNPGYLSHKTRTQNNVEAFTQKIDFSTVELRKTNLPYMEAEKREYFDKVGWK